MGAPTLPSLHRTRPWLLAGAVALAFVLCAVFTRALLGQTGGARIAPIDDAYIHLQYARALAEGRFFAYQAGDAYSSGATSPLWVALLAPFARFASSEGLLAVATWFGALGLGLLLHATARAATALRGGWSAALPAGALLAGQGFLLWSAFSAMETVPFAAAVLSVLWLFGGWISGPPPRALVALLALLPLVRPDGLVVVGPVVLVVLVRGVRDGRVRATLGTVAVVLAPVVVGALVHHACYGRLATAGMEMKALPYLPYLSPSQAHLKVLGGFWRSARELFWGEKPGFWPAWWTVIVLTFALCAAIEEVRRRRLGAALLAWILVPALLWAGAEVGVTQFRQERYFVPALAVLSFVGALGVAAVGDWSRRLARQAPLIVDLGVVLGALLALAPTARTWRATFAADGVSIMNKQVSAARWIAQHTPPDARVMVCDAGALAVLSGRRVFDVVGLTSPHGGNAYLSGPGSRFEEVERLGPGGWPTHGALYHWCRWPGVDYQIVSRHADLEVSVFRDPGFGTGEAPLAPHARVLDRLDAADLGSERAHRWHEDDGGTFERNVIARHVVAGRQVADGGRVVVRRATFTLSGGGGARKLLLRTEGDARGTLAVGAARQPIAASGAGFHELTFEVPASAEPIVPVTVEAAPGARVGVYSVWLLGG